MQGFRIVGIGASAGGLESLEQLFTALPADAGMAYVVVQHLSPDFRSVMDELIGRRSNMPVHVVEDGMAVEPNHIYLLPPRKEMVVRGRRLLLTDKPHGLSLPIDMFFRSLAQDVGIDAIAVVLSGSGSDGSRGIIDVKRAGGTVMIESPATAKFDGMPLSAQNTGAVDHVATPGDLARLLCGLPPLEPGTDEVEALSADPGMDSLLRLLRDSFGLDFSLYKGTMVARRIQRRLDLQRVSSVPAYIEQLRADPTELNALYQDLLIGVTQFFRDAPAFELLERELVPQLVDAVAPEQEIRVWCAGCGTGEEAYSLAMLFHEALTARDRPLRLKILATDVHPSSLETASLGLYGEHQLGNLSEARRDRFFTRRTSGYQISQDLRQHIVFARHNLTKDAPFTKMHFISCRNVLIYLQPHAQRSVMSLFHFGLTSGGLLMLGPSESVGPLSDEFDALDERWKVFRKRRDVPLIHHVRLPIGGPRRVPVEAARPIATDPQILATYDQLLDRFMPPSLLIDEQRCLIDSFGGAERLLQVPRRRPSHDVRDMLRGELSTATVAAIQRAFKDGRPVAFAGVRLEDGGDRRCTITAAPLVHPRTHARSVLVSFEGIEGGAATDVAADAITPEPVAAHQEQASREQRQALENELAYTRETLQATIEELETSNEEMQATNEELVAANEELQSTNEELHSVNEELYTVNAEYQQKIVELKQLNADIEHLLEGTDVGTLFLDHELCIRRFTSRMATVFHLQPHDVGRKLGDFSHNIERATLMAEIERVLATGATIEDEVRDRVGRPFFLRILPYRIARDARDAEPAPIVGVVLTLTDLSVLAVARAHVAQLSAIVESSDDAIIGLALDDTITSWNRAAQQLYGYSAAEIVGKSVRTLLPPEHEASLAAQFDALRRGERVDRVHVVHVRKDGARLDVAITLSPIEDRAHQLVGISAIAHDIGPMLATQRELEQRAEENRALLASTAEAAQRREQFLAMLSHELRNPLAAVINATRLLRDAPAPAVHERCIAVLDRQAGHMARLLDDLLDVSRITRGKLQLHQTDLDLRVPIEAAIEATSPLFATRQIELDVNLPELPVPVRGDAARLQQVAANLLSNAANYSPTGSRVALRLSFDPEQATLRVTDRGIGIAPDMLGRIFELFVQAEQHLDRPRGGLGVGLSLARSIVELHGGTIEATSGGPNRGAELTVRLPLVAIADPSVEVPQRATSRRRIVLVEDQLDSREMLRMLLESRDHEVLDTGDGASAVELIARARPDIALIDIGLPMMDGYEVAQRVRERSDLQHVRLVALTGYGAPGDVAAARDAGFDAHLVKPVDLSRIEELLDRFTATTSSPDRT